MTPPNGSADGSSLLYSTFLGGSPAFDRGLGIAVDSSGNAYVNGAAESANFPTTAGAYQVTLKGSRDAFVTKLNPTGSALVYPTYLGGSAFDTAFGIAVDSGGNAYVAGSTFATSTPPPLTPNDFPTTPGAFQQSAARMATMLLLPNSIPVALPWCIPPFWAAEPWTPPLPSL